MERSPSWCKLWKSSNQGMVIKKKRRKKSRNLNSPESYIKYGTAATLPRGGRPLSQSPRMTLKAPQRSDWKSWTTKPETGLHERVLRQKAILKLFQKKKKKNEAMWNPMWRLRSKYMFLQSVETKMDTTSGRNSNLLITLKTPSSQRSTGLVSSRSGDSYHQRDREMSPLMEKRLQKMSPTVTRGIHNNAKRKETDK